EAALNASTRPANLVVEGRPVTLSAADIIAGRGITEHLSTMRSIGEATLGPDGRPRITEPRTIVDLGGNVRVDLLNPTRTVEGRALTTTELGLMQQVRESPHGQRIAAEHALTMIEEMFHIRQFMNNGAPI